jgi:hypothetical protein
MHCSSSIHELALLGHSVRHTYSKEDIICRPQLSQCTISDRTKSQRMESSIAIASLTTTPLITFGITLRYTYLPPLLLYINSICSSRSLGFASSNHICSLVRSLAFRTTHSSMLYCTLLIFSSFLLYIYSCLLFT